MSEQTFALDSDTAVAPGRSFWRRLAGLFARALRRVRLPSSLVLLAAAAMAVHGNSILLLSPNQWQRYDGLPWLGGAAVVWLAGELLGNWSVVRGWWRGLDRAGRLLAIARIAPAGMLACAFLLIIESMFADSALPLLLSALGWFAAGVILWLLLWLAGRRLRAGGASGQAVPKGLALADRGQLRGQAAPMSWRRFLLVRGTVLALAVAVTAAVWQQTADNRFHGNALWLWFASAALWSALFAPRGWVPTEWLAGRIDAWRRARWGRHWWAILCFAGIMALALVFRFARLDVLPSEMLNSDHAYEIIIALDIFRGERPVILQNFQFHESMHAYLTALVGGLPGQGFSHYSLKFTTSLESLVTVLIMFWLGMECVGREGRKYRVAMGLLCAGLVAVSYWHVVTTRYAQRTTLTPLFAALTMVYLARAMRCNRRGDYIKLGLVLGFGMYSYSAFRVWPLAVAAGLILPLALRRLSMRQRLDYVMNGLVAALIAFVVYLPQYRYFSEQPVYAQSQFTQGLFGVNPGEAIEIDPDAFATRLMSSFRDAILMFHWSGDHRSWQNVPFRPALNEFTGAFMALGLAALFARLVKRPRDPALWLLPMIILIAMLPSALVLAHPLANPSNTRVSGAIPAVYMLVALPMLTLASRLASEFRPPWGKLAGAALCISIVLAGAQRNAIAYFNEFAQVNIQPGESYRHIGMSMRGIVGSGGSWGNIFMISGAGLRNDARNVFIEAGEPDLVAVASMDGMINYLRHSSQLVNKYRLDPNEDILFFLSSLDYESVQRLQQWFPDGRAVEISDPAYMRLNYLIFRVPAPGEAGLRDILDRHA